jgi:hypothetical protein
MCFGSTPFVHALFSDRSGSYSMFLETRQFSQYLPHHSSLYIPHPTLLYDATLKEIVFLGVETLSPFYHPL